MKNSKKIHINIIIKFLAVLTTFAVIMAGCTSSNTYTLKRNTVKVKTDNGFLWIKFCTPSVVNIRFTKTETFGPDTSLAVVNPYNDSVNIAVHEYDSVLEFSSNKIVVVYHKKSINLTFKDSSGKTILTEAPHGQMLQEATVTGDKTYHISDQFRWQPGEALYGLGQHQDDIMNYRGHNVLLVQDNKVSVTPVLVSSNGYGLLWDNYSQTEFRDQPDSTSTSSKSNVGEIWSESGDALNYYLFYGPSIDKVIASYRKATGQAPMFGKWAYGLWQSKEHYHTQKQILDVVKEYRKEKIPLDNIVQDWFYWDPQPWGSHYFDRNRYPDPIGMIKQVHDEHAHIMISVWAKFDPGSPNYKELDSLGLLYPASGVYGNAQFYDAFNPLARKIYWKQINDSLFVKGVDAWWLDATEPELGDLREDKYKKIMNNYLGSGAKYLNAYSLMTTKAVYEGQRSVTDNKRVFILTRSAFAGQQRNAAATWSGDITASWEVFHKQIPAGINFCYSGIPYWTTDIGAFFVTGYAGGNQNREYQELFTRWYQFGAFCPIFRVHGTSTPREMYEFGNPGYWAYDAQLKADNLRYRLMPYIYSLAGMVTQQGYTIMRGLEFDFPNDEKAKNIDDQYMFGNAFLVAPVTRAMYNRDFSNLAFLSGHIPSSAFRTGNLHGLKGEYFSDIHFSKKITEKVDSVIDFSWGTNCPQQDMPADSFTIRWTGKIIAPEDGEYTFVTYSDDGTRLWLNNQQIIDDWTQHAAEYHTGKIALQKGQSYDIKMEYLEIIGGASTKLSWILPARDLEKEKKEFAQNKNTIKNEDVYLPAGSSWFNFWTGKHFDGGQTVSTPAPIDEIPLYVKAGSIVPMGPYLQYADEKPTDPVELRIYPGQDGVFTLYEDEGDNFNYEKGAFSIIPVKWDDSGKLVTIGTRKGSFAGMLAKRTFNLVLVNENCGVGLSPSSSINKVVEYDGTAQSITLK